METPRVWVGCLGCYNAGSLTGAWVDGIDAEEYEPHDSLDKIIRPACMTPKSDERWVFDHEGYDGLLSGECSPMEAARVARLIEAVEEEDQPVSAVAAWAAHVGDKLEEWDAPTREAFEDAYCGEWDSEQAYAEDMADSCGLLNEEATWPNNYIDWEAATRDLFMGDYFSVDTPGGVYVFRSY